MKRIALPILAAASMLAQVANAQSSSTPVIGYYKFDVPAGATAWTSGFVTKKNFQGASVSSAIVGATTEITQTGAAWTPGAFNLHYVEVLSGPNTGLILDVASNTADKVTVSTAVTLPPGTTYCIRKHATLGTLFLNGGGLVADTDTVIFLKPDGSETVALYSGGSWVDANNPAILLNDLPVYPCQGFIIAAGDARVVTFGGNDVSYVKTGPTMITIYAGQPNLVAPVNPLVATNPADPIYSTLGVTTAANLNLRPALDDDSDVAIKFTEDGALTEDKILLDSGGSLVDVLNPAVILDTLPIGNGRAIAIVPGADRPYVAPQTFTSN